MHPTEEEVLLLVQYFRMFVIPFKCYADAKEYADLACEKIGAEQVIVLDTSGEKFVWDREIKLVISNEEFYLAVDETHGNYIPKEKYLEAVLSLKECVKKVLKMKLKAKMNKRR